MKNLIFSLIIISLYSCDYFSSENTNTRVEEGVKTIGVTMVEDYENDKTNFISKFQNRRVKTNDSLEREHLENYYSQTIQVLNYIDSLKNVLTQIKASPQTIAVIKKYFIQDSIGNKLFNKIKTNYDLMVTISRTQPTISGISTSRTNLLNEPNTQQRINQYFGLNSSTGVMMLLYGFEKELLRVGNIALEDK